MDFDIVKMFHEKDMDKLLKEVKDQFDNEKASNNRLRERLAEYNKDDEIIKLKEENDRIRRNAIDILSDDEAESAKKFRNIHWNKCKNGNIFQYELIGTGFSTVVKIKCPKCGEELDITDYGCW